MVLLNYCGAQDIGMSWLSYCSDVLDTGVGLLSYCSGAHFLEWKF